MSELGIVDSDGNLTIDDDQHRIHVYDLPQLYSRPPYKVLAAALDLLIVQPASFSQSIHREGAPKVDPQGVPRYLTSIVASSLSWLESDTEREQIWDLASVRLSERSGRNAVPSMSRSFKIQDNLVINLFEPSLTEDNLGLKTWTSSVLLARRLPLLRHHIPVGCGKVLELGSGTGLVGIAAAILWNINVVLTDLPEILPNLQKNVEQNSGLLGNRLRELHVEELDWSVADHKPQHDDQRFGLMLAADPIYSTDHPGLLAEAVARWIECSPHSRFIVELPLRDGYAKERLDLREQLAKAGMTLMEEGTEVGYDDWQNADGSPTEVECWWSVWRFSTKDTVVES